MREAAITIFQRLARRQVCELGFQDFVHLVDRVGEWDSTHRKNEEFWIFVRQWPHMEVINHNQEHHAIKSPPAPSFKLVHPFPLSRHKFSLSATSHKTLDDTHTPAPHPPPTSPDGPQTSPHKPTFASHKIPPHSSSSAKTPVPHPDQPSHTPSQSQRCQCPAPAILDP